MLLELGLPSFNTLGYITLMSVLLTGCQRVTMFLFNVFSLTCNVQGALLFSVVYVFLLFYLCLSVCGLYSACFVCMDSNGLIQNE